jgi:uncharacterized protein (TIGR00255 family)
MIVSMTGFGDASAQRNGTHYLVEIRSLNNRYFKAVIKLPETLAGLEPEIEVMLRERLGRGSITFVLKVRTDSADAAYPINTAALESYIRQIRTIPAFSQAHLDLSALLALPGVCQEPTDDSEEIARHSPVIRELTTRAIEKLEAMRAREGASLFNDLKKHLSIVEANVEAVEKRAPLVVQEYHKRLAARVNELLRTGELKVDESDLIKEVAVFAERSDISEEIHRLRHHCRQFIESCQTSEHAGRKLDFITQEMLREANTIASKANDAVVAGHIVEVKGAIDRLKEQVQNVE